MSQVYWQTRWHKQYGGTQPPEGTRPLWKIGPYSCDSDRLGSWEHSPVQATWGTCLSEAFAAQTRSGQLPSASLVEQCASINTSQDRFTNKTRRVITPHGSEPSTLYEVGNTGRNWVCLRSPVSLGLALWHWQNSRAHQQWLWRQVLNGSWSAEDAVQSPSHRPHQWMYCWWFSFCFLWLLPLQKEQPCTKQPVSFLEQPRIYSWTLPLVQRDKEKTNKQTKKSRHI